MNFTTKSATLRSKTTLVSVFAALGFVGFTTVILVATTSTFANGPQPVEDKQQQKRKMQEMKLGVFSVSLAVKDIKASFDFYSNLGFEKVGGNMDQNWIILQNGETTIGLFQGMFEKNIMTFNPGWNKDQETLKDFEDVRELQAKLKEAGIQLATEAEAGTGPASFTLMDPDGNPILVDQHVNAPN